MKARASRVRAFGGAALRGDKVVRVAFLDEAGTSNPAHEPWITVSGIVIDADKQWNQIESHLVELADELAPPGKRDGFIFHAKELLNGGKIFPRGEYDIVSRMAILERVAKIPQDYELPVLFGFAERATLFEGESASGLTRKEHTTACVVSAFIHCVVELEKFMREFAGKDEVAMIVMEDNPEARRIIRESHRLLCDSDQLKHIPPEDMAYLPLTRIKDIPYFAAKTDSSLLQIADACAAITKRHLARKPHINGLYGLLADNMIARPMTDFQAPSS